MPEAGAPATPVVELSRRSRLWRGLATLTVVGLLLTGTAVGQDDAFPFGPLRMFSTTQSLDGAVVVLRLEALTPDQGWVRTGLNRANIGLNRAEVEGQSQRFQAEPALLDELAAAHARLHPEDAPWDGVRVVRRRTELAGGSPTGKVTETEVVRWTRPGVVVPEPDSALP